MTYKLILTTCPDLTCAHTLAEGLIERNIAACVNILPAMVSVYKWQGNIEQAAESQLFIKTNESNWSKVESYIQQHHPYDVPEIIEIDISNGSSEYFSWMQNNLQQGE